MKAYRQSMCPRCDQTIRVGDDIKKQFLMKGVGENGRPIFQATDRYIHSACKKAKLVERRWDPETGELLT